jgi:hypothetical protein
VFCACLLAQLIHTFNPKGEGRYIQSGRTFCTRMGVAFGPKIREPHFRLKAVVLPPGRGLVFLARAPVT